jgi:uncharacterized delta-60 repeat protein
MRFVLFYLSASLLFCITLYGSGGTLDSSFDGDGVAITKIYSSRDTVFDLLTLSDGKKIVVGNSYDGGYNIALMRLDSNGLIDENYGKNAKVKYACPTWAKYSTANGTDIFVACRSYNVDQFTIYNIEEDGTLSSFFGTNGIVSTNFTTDVLLNSIIAAGSVLYAAGETSDNKLFIAKFSSFNGSLITSFGTNGLYIDDSYTTSQIKTMAVSNSKLYVSGNYVQGGKKYLFIRAYNLNDDSVDTSFGTNGTASYAVTQDVFPVKMALQSDGKIVVLAFHDDVTTGAYIIRYNTDGTLDNSYANQGTLSLDGDYTEDFFLDSSDNLIAHISYDIDSTNPSEKLVKFSSNNGSVISSVSTVDNAYSIIGALADGKILLLNSKNEDFNFARYLSSGSIDTNYGSEGKVVVDFNDQIEYAMDIVVQPDGKVVVAGVSSNGVNDDFFVARYNHDGSLDNSFANHGKVTTDFQGSNDIARAVALQSDGKIVVVGYTDVDTHKDIAIARYNTNGTLDTSFDSDGKVWSNLENNDTLAVTLVIDSSGNIIVGGTINTASSGGYDFLIARYLPNGQLDNNFGSSSGYTKSNMGSDSDAVIKLLKYSNGFYAVGNHYLDGANSIDGDIIVSYYLSNGTQECTPSSNIHISNADEVVFDALLDAQGRIVIVGSIMTNNNNLDQLVIRFNPMQGIDKTFANGTGWISIDTGSDNDKAVGVGIDSNNHIVVGGEAIAPTTLKQYATVSMFNQDGAWYKSFGFNGFSTSLSSKYSLSPLSMVLDKQNNILFAGANKTDISVIRFLGMISVMSPIYYLLF